MSATTEQLKARWETGKGRLLLKKIIDAATRDWHDWSGLLTGFDHVGEVPEGRDLRCADLGGADADGACLIRANLSGANLQRASLIGAFLGGANLANADLSWARLSGSDLRDANLTHASLNGASLQNANLRRAKLNESNLTEAVLNAAHCQSANLSAAKLLRTSMVRTDLGRALLNQADLTDANLRGARLLNASLEGAILTGAHLNGTVRTGWRIAGVACEHVVVDAKQKMRLPKSRRFEAGEFERIYASLATVEVALDPAATPIAPAAAGLVMDRVAERVREQHPDLALRLAAIDMGDLGPVFTFTVSREEDRAPALAEIQQALQAICAQLEGKAETLRDAITRLVDEEGGR